MDMSAENEATDLKAMDFMAQAGARRYAFANEMVALALSAPTRFRTCIACAPLVEGRRIPAAHEETWRPSR